MYIVGHAVATEMSGCFAPGEALGAGIVALMLPDYARCHDWGYERCFDAVPATSDARLIRAHMLGDWYVHYGPGRDRRRVGWAYRRMRVFAQRYRAFFDDAAARGLRDGTSPCDSPRGFAHSMAEYCIDTWLAEHGAFDGPFAAVKRNLGTLGTRESTAFGSWEWIECILRGEGITVDPALLAVDVASFRDRVARSDRPAELAYRAGIRKFGLVESQDALSYVASVIAAGLDTMEHDEIPRLLDSIAAFIAEGLGRPWGERKATPWT